MRRTDYAPKHRLEVRYDVKLAMADKLAIEIAYEIIANIVGDDQVKMYEEKRKIRRRRPLWRCEVSSKDAVYRVLSAIEPHMRAGKKLEAQLCLRYLERARHHVRYRADDYDRRLADVATGLRNGCGEARIEGRELLDQVIPSQAAEGSSSAEGVEATTVRPNNNPSQERPAPHPRIAEGEDMVRSSKETSSGDFNGRRPRA